MSFLPIPLYPEYVINEYGDVFSFKRSHIGRGRKTEIDKDGYRIITLSVNGKPKKEKIHRLVAQVFVKGDNSLYINHIDGNKLNNHFSNLEWVTNQRNQQHAWLNSLKRKILTVDDVRTIRKLLVYKTNTDIAKMFNVNQSTISNIKTGKTWKFLK